MASVAVPPFADAIVGAGIIITNDQHAPALDPVGQGRVNVCAQRFHSLIRQQQDAKAIQVMRSGDIFKLHRGHWHTAFEQWKGQAVHVAEMRVAGAGFAALEHQ